MRFTIKVLILLFIFIGGVAGIAVYTTFFAPLPDYGDTLRIEALNQSTDIHWDPYGVPFISAENEEDLYFAMGYVHAQERLWQMTLLQLRAEGRFAEFLGDEFLQADRFHRTIGLWQTAQKMEEAAPDSLQTLLQSYADGVNRYIELNRRRLPPQFVLLDVQPIRWTPAHSFAAIRLIAWEANLHWRGELTYADLERRLSSYQFQQLVPEYESANLSSRLQEDTNELSSHLFAFLDADQHIRNMLGGSVSASGSNAWAISGEKTVSGLPILAADSHNSITIPGPWFDVTHSTPGFQISGATFPGIPFILKGQTEHHAWAMTSLYADDTDFFLERVSDEDPDSYLVESDAAGPDTLSFDKRREIIRVKNGDDQLHIIRSTRHGPVISDIDGVGSPDTNLAVTLRWTGHDVSHELLALYEMNRATSMNQFRMAAERYKVPATNIVYADNQNNIALFTSAAIPIRDYNPLAFRQGWNPDYDWNGFISFDELPHIINPDNGIVAHANNRHFDENYPFYIGSLWEPSSRIQRITEQLEMSDNQNVESMQELQFDVVSEQAREITELILPMLRNGDRNNQIDIALNYLENWNFRYEPTSTASSVFDFFMVRLSENTFLDEIGEEAFENLVGIGHLPPAILTRMLSENSLLFDDINTPEVETREEIVRKSMLQVIDELTDRYGEEPYSWRWENAVHFELSPPLLDELAGDSLTSRSVLRPVIRNLFSHGPYTVRGNPMTVNKIQYRWSFPFVMEQGATVRRIIDFSEPGRSLTILPTGQSGNPLSEFYGNQTDLWLEGRYRYIYHDSSFFDQTIYQTTRLTPQ